MDFYQVNLLCINICIVIYGAYHIIRGLENILNAIFFISNKSYIVISSRRILQHF